MLTRLLCVAIGVLAMAVGGHAQNGVQGGCPSMELQESCVLTVMRFTSNTNPTPTDQTVLNLGFVYCAPAATLYGTGPILGSTTGTLTVTSGGTVTSFSVSAFGTGGPAPQTTATVTTAPPSNGLASIVSFANTFITVTSLFPNPIVSTTAQISNNGAPANVASNGIIVPLGVIPQSQQTLGVVSQASCSAVRGDPLFSGFMGQQFYVGGEDGQVFNMLSTPNMQLNGRFVNLEEGAAMLPAEQEKLRLQSVVAHLSEPSVAALPETTPWNHPGNYFGEVGVAMMDDNRIHAKAGAYQTGFAKVTLNGRPIPVSDDFIVLGAGANTTFVQRVSASELMVRTVSVEFTVTNSDNFINVENVHLEKGFAKQRKVGGMLGHSISSKWSWALKDEEAAVVKSNNLFELTPVA